MHETLPNDDLQLAVADPVSVGVCVVFDDPDDDDDGDRVAVPLAVADPVSVGAHVVSR